MPIFALCANTPKPQEAVLREEAETTGLMTEQVNTDSEAPVRVKKTDATPGAVASHSCMANNTRTEIDMLLGKGAYESMLPA